MLGVRFIHALPLISYGARACWRACACGCRVQCDRPARVQIGAAEPCRSLEHLRTNGFPADKALGAGVIDGRNVWADQGAAATLLADIQGLAKGDVRVQARPCSATP